MDNLTKNSDVPIHLPARVYFVSSPEDGTVLVAMDILIQNNRITWFDTIKERTMEISKIEDGNPEHFVFERAGEPLRTYTFVPMSLDIYRSKVKSGLVQGKDFATEEELFLAFEETKKDVW